MYTLKHFTDTRTISEEALRVISGILPLRVLAEERPNLCQRKRSTALGAEELRKEERQHSTARCQHQSDAAEKAQMLHDDSLKCQSNPGVAEDVEHVSSLCSQHDKLEKDLKNIIQPKKIVEKKKSKK